MFALHSMEFKLRIPQHCGLFQHTLPVTPTKLVLLMTVVTVPIIKTCRILLWWIGRKGIERIATLMEYFGTCHLQIPCFIVEEDEGRSWKVVANNFDGEVEPPQLLVRVRTISII